MGKLYKLRRAIEKDPEKWTSTFDGYVFGGVKSAEYVTRRPYWIKKRTSWKPGWKPKEWDYGTLSYRDFVRSVLDSLKKK